MSELLGLAASAAGIASLAIQIGGIVLKLRQVWGNIRNSGEEIKYLIEEIETLSLILRELGGGNDREEEISLPEAPAEKSLALCRKGADVLSEILLDLDKEVSRRRLVGGLKATLKATRITQLRDRLRSAQSLLMLSYQIYTEALQRQRHDQHIRYSLLHREQIMELKEFLGLAAGTVTERQAAHASQLLPYKRWQNWVSRSKDTQTSILHLQSPSQIPERRDSTLDPRTKRKESRKRRFEARFRTPHWSTNAARAWELSAYHMDSSWMLVFRTYNIVPAESAILEHVQQGNVKEIRRLFDDRKASPFDRDPDNFTLLDIAAQFHRLDVCRLLIELDADPNISAYDSMLQAPCMPNVWVRGTEARINKNFFELVRTLTKGTDYEDFAEKNSLTDLGPYEVITWLVQQYDAECGCARDARRARIIETSIAKLAFQPNMASLIRMRLGGKKLQDMLGPETAQGRFLLHCAAQNLAEHCAFSPPHIEPGTSSTSISPMWTNSSEDRWNCNERRELFLLIKELVTAGFDLHRLNYFGRTPLHALFAWFIQWPNPYPPGHESCRLYSAEQNEAHLKTLATRFLIPARIWLEQLASAGVDLLQYGEREKQQNFEKSAEVGNECFYNWQRKDAEETTKVTLKLRLTSFVYGAFPCDWQFWVTEVLDESFMEFWEMVDHPERGMPGAWSD